MSTTPPPPTWTAEDQAKLDALKPFDLTAKD